MEFRLDELFLTILNMSITGSYAIAFILLARMLLKKAPKIISYGLWSVALVRLVCPISFSSAFSLLGAMGAKSTQYIPSDIAAMEQPAITTGIAAMDQAVNQNLPAAVPFASANPLQIVLSAASWIWAVGLLLFLAYSGVSYFLLKRKVSSARHIDDNVFETKGIATPFVLGFFRPKIYLPEGINADERKYILLHEQTHIRRRDVLIKPLAFLVLATHWFNPFVWIAYSFMTRDMEMSCDEKVLKTMGTKIKKNYSRSLLSQSSDCRWRPGSPLAFGENPTKARIKNVLNYKKPALWLLLVALLAAGLTACALLSDPKSEEVPEEGSFAVDIEGVNLRLTLPESWQNRYEIEEVAETGTIIVSRKDSGGGGMLFFINRELGDIPQSALDNQPVPTHGFYASGYTYLLSLPTDVQAPMEMGEEAVAEYKRMASEVAWVFDHLESIEDAPPPAQNAGFKVVGTADFIMEIPENLEVQRVESTSYIHYNLLQSEEMVGFISFVPDDFQVPETFITENEIVCYLREPGIYKKACLTTNLPAIAEDDQAKMAESFIFRGYGGYTGIDLQTDANRYLARGGEEIFGQIEKFIMEDETPIAVRIKLYRLDRNPDLPNGVQAVDLQQTGEFPLDMNYRATVLPLAPPDYNVYDLYNFPSAEDWALADGTLPNPYGDLFYRFIATNGEIKIILGQYLP